jgi:hypothetical protein
MIKERATEILRFGIKTVQGKTVKSNFNTTLSILIGLKEELENNGFWWQARTLNYWIHRFQGNRGFLQTREASLTHENGDGGLS